MDSPVKPENDGGGSWNDMICDKNDPYDYAKTQNYMQVKNCIPACKRWRAKYFSVIHGSTSSP